jgi:hypothetical protein
VNNASDLVLSRQIEDLLVSRNLRGMQTVQSALEPGYFLRAATMLRDCKGTVLIGTGFPVADTFETDGPVGAIALYECLEQQGANPILVCGDPLASAIAADYQVYEIGVGALEHAAEETRLALADLRPEVIISIERPGLSECDHYFNIRGEDITARCACFDYFLRLANCPTIAIGDGGNEIGMGNIREAIAQLDIVPAVTCCDELLLADVSNWAAHGIITLLSKWQGEDLLAVIDTQKTLQYLSHRGSVDGVTRENTLTEDSLPASDGQQLIDQLRALIGFNTGG